MTELNSPGPLDLACDGYGSVPAHYMFVGISAGQRGALISKVPLTKDSSGRLFQRCLNQIGLSRSDELAEKPDLVDTYVTNLVKGRCLTVNGQNRLPTDNEVDFWMPRFEEEIEAVSPKLIVLLGNWVFKHSVKIRWTLIRDKRIILRIVKHPRWYASHGALASQNHPAFKEMVEEYQEACNHTNTSKDRDH